MITTPRLGKLRIDIPHSDVPHLATLPSSMRSPQRITSRQEGARCGATRYPCHRYYGARCGVNTSSDHMHVGHSDAILSDAR